MKKKMLISSENGGKIAEERKFACVIFRKDVGMKDIVLSEVN